MRSDECVKFNVEFPRQVMNLPKEACTSKERDQQKSSLNMERRVFLLSLSLQFVLKHISTAKTSGLYFIMHILSETRILDLYP